MRIIWVQSDNENKHLTLRFEYDKHTKIESNKNFIQQNYMIVAYRTFFIRTLFHVGVIYTMFSKGIFESM